MKRLHVDSSKRLEHKVRKPKSDPREYGFTRLANGARILLVQDPEAVFAAACANVQAGYFDDPDDVPGLAHYLEHAVHLGSERYPDEKEYKAFLSQHGGASNASTSMVHTSFYLKIHSSMCGPALHRMGAMLEAPRLKPESVLREVENVHSEFSRNTNSDARKLLQLRRSTSQPPYSKFSTGNITTLRDDPMRAGLDVSTLLRGYWEKKYTGDGVCVCIVAPQPISEQESWVKASFEGIRTSSQSAPMGEGAPKGLIGSGFTTAIDSTQLGLLYSVIPQRELRELELRWHIPYGMMRDMECKPWRWVSHIVGHESKGSAAYALKQAGLIQSLSAGTGDEVRLGPGFMFWSVTMQLTEEGLDHVSTILKTIHRALQVILSSSSEQRQAIYEELQETSLLRFEYRDRQQPADLAKDAAQKLHYFDPEEVLAGPMLLNQFDEEAIRSFMSHLVPQNLNVYFSTKRHQSNTAVMSSMQVERWYGAKYSVAPFDEGLKAELAALVASLPPAESTPSTGPTTTATASATSVAPLMPLLHLPSANWALPVDAALMHSLPGLSPASSVSPTPTVLLERPGIRVWHCCDVSHRIPKAYVYLMLATPAVYRDPKAWITARLFVRLLDDLLEADAYHAEVLGCSYSVNCSEEGISIQMTGFSSVIPKLLDLVLHGLATGVTEGHVQERFDVMAGKMLQSMQVWKHNNPLQHAEYEADHFLQRPHWHVLHDSLPLLEKNLISPEDVLAFGRSLIPPRAGAGGNVDAEGGSTQVEMLLYGSLSSHQAAAISESVCETLRPAGLGSSPWPEVGIVQLYAPRPVEGTTSHPGNTAYVYVPDNPNPGNSNSAIFLVCQVGMDDPADRSKIVLLQLLVQIASKPCFHALRTVQRLGYTAGCQLYMHQGFLGFAVRVQAANYKPDVVGERVVQWLHDFRAELASVDSDTFEAHKSSLRERLLEPTKSLADAASRAWMPIRRRTFDFGAREAKAEFLSGTTLPNLLSLYDANIIPSGPSTQTLCTQMWGGGVPPEVEQKMEAVGSASTGEGEQPGGMDAMSAVAHVVCGYSHLVELKVGLECSYRPRL
eukprot:gene25195-10835_t